MVSFQVQSLSPAGLVSPAVRHLLWLACEHSDAELDRLLREVLPRFEVLGVSQTGGVNTDGHGEDAGVIAFAASHVADGGRGERWVELEYLATHEHWRHHGLGRLLVDAVRQRHVELPVHLSTDDDAVDFYRRLGFAVATATEDPRWPGTRRYDCRLPPIG